MRSTPTTRNVFAAPKHGNVSSAGAPDAPVRSRPNAQGRFIPEYAKYSVGTPGVASSKTPCTDIVSGVRRVILGWPPTSSYAKIPPVGQPVESGLVRVPRAPPLTARSEKSFVNVNLRVPDLAKQSTPRRSNLAAFTLNNPLRYLDPDGLDSTSNLSHWTDTFGQDRSARVHAAGGDDMTYSMAKKAYWDAYMTALWNGGGGSVNTGITVDNACDGVHGVCEYDAPPAQDPIFWEDLSTVARGGEVVPFLERPMADMHDQEAFKRWQSRYWREYEQAVGTYGSIFGALIGVGCGSFPAGQS